jgi:hypothetical protein
MNTSGASPVDPAVTRESFLKWRSPRIGKTNPERMNNPVWEWLIKSGIDAYHATQRFDEASTVHAEPGWCFLRYGQSTVQLPDGRVVHIAGEHEDYYDPDFYIYNDVVVQHTDGHVEIFGYPREVFPPTDFHSATLVDNRIVIIGTSGIQIIVALARRQSWSLIWRLFLSLASRPLGRNQVGYTSINRRCQMTVGRSWFGMA